ncbi:MAG: hypothetical protein QOH16_176 [Gaiellaceae bacterium]|nr:hypothetical protein [Gaiellaceae bacterium]
MRTVVLAAAVILAFAVAGIAAADGLPVLGIDVGSQGVTVPGGPDRYVTINDGKTTLLERIARNGGRVEQTMRMTGTFTIPAVAYDSSASGLSADGGTLVLIQPRQSFPRATTTFALLDVPSLFLRRTFTLRGDFSFDAVSPHGRTMFLINYTSPDPTRYTVRAYDLTANTLLAKPIVDPAEPSDKMRGGPITRLAGVGGRWAYTLYDGAGATPFVHALDTVTGRAHCTALPMLFGRQDLASLRFRRESGTKIGVEASGTAVAVVDTATFAASVPPVAGTSNLRLWPIGAAGLFAALALLAALAVTRSRRSRARNEAEVLDPRERVVEVVQ